VLAVGPAAAPSGDATELGQRHDRHRERRGEASEVAIAADESRVADLTHREREILLAVGRGWSNGEIAEQLHLAESTVKTHVKRVLAKTGSRDRIEAVILTYDLGLTRPRSVEPGFGEVHCCCCRCDRAGWTRVRT
jgi:DNA-binding NarL/FixJ family response regulator